MCVAGRGRGRGRGELEQAGQAAGHAGRLPGAQPDPGPVDGERVALVARRPGWVKAQRRGQAGEVRGVAEVDRDRGPPLAVVEGDGSQRDATAPCGVLGEASGQRGQDRVAVGDGGACAQAELTGCGPEPRRRGDDRRDSSH
jgi:hypothetical protein